MASDTLGIGEAQSVVQSSPSRQPRKNFIFTHPRSASNLLKRVLNLSSQPNLISDAKRDYFFLPLVAHRYLRLKDRHINEWTPEQSAAVAEEYRSCVEGIEEHVRQSMSQVKDVFISEHTGWMVEPVAEMKWALNGSGQVGDEIEPFMADCLKKKYGDERSQFNQTIFPDGWLMSWQPTFLIRHPALAFPSLYRTGVDLQGKEFASTDPKHVSEMTWRWSRALYDFYRQNHEHDVGAGNDGYVRWPIVLDADDVISDPAVITKYCKIVGLDPAMVRYEWSVASQEKLGKMRSIERRMWSTLSASTGIVEGKTSVGLDIEQEAKQWKSEFGEKEGEKMEKWVRAAMPDYEYMREKRLRCTP